jgi:1-acyl-sn-glycerol-3-phosphate acyltransferase
MLLLEVTGWDRMLIRSVLFNIALYLNFTVLGVLFSPVLLLPQKWGWPVVRIWASSSLWWHRVICGVGEDIRGLENRPSGGYIVACKHQSAWETLRLVTLVDKPAFVLKRELMWMPIFGWYLYRFGQIPVDRGKRSAALQGMTEHARRAIANGQQVIIFPEGTRRAPGSDPHYRYGVVHLYKTLGVPCLPIAVNSGLFWPRRASVHVQGTIRVDILPPIAPGLEGNAFQKLLQTQIESASRALNDEALQNFPAVGQYLRKNSGAS